MGVIFYSLVSWDSVGFGKYCSHIHRVALYGPMELVICVWFLYVILGWRYALLSDYGGVLKRGIQCLSWYERHGAFHTFTGICRSAVGSRSDREDEKGG
jgi:hypothetical protein